jgi:hypothetical protein
MRRWLVVAVIGFTVSAFGQDAEPRTRLGKALESNGYVSKEYAPLYKPGFPNHSLVGSASEHWSLDVRSVAVRSDGPPITGIMVVAEWTAYGSVPAGHTWYIDADEVSGLVGAIAKIKKERDAWDASRGRRFEATFVTRDRLTIAAVAENPQYPGRVRAVQSYFVGTQQNLTPDQFAKVEAAIAQFSAQ